MFVRMRRGLPLSLVALAALFLAAVTFVGGASAAPNPNASCTGILHEFVASTGDPGAVADFTRLFHQMAKDAGLPPGTQNSSVAKLHLGDPFSCFS